MANIKAYINYLIESKIDKDSGIQMIKSDINLSDDQKLLIERYCYPRILGDMELPNRVKEYLTSIGNSGVGFNTIDRGMVGLLVEAYRTEQYGKFMRHLMHSFLDPTKIFPIAGVEKEVCPICGKPLYQHDLWLDLVTNKRPGTPEKENKNYLAFGSEGSSVAMCKSCLIQLVATKDEIENITPGFLNIRKLPWEDLKL